MFKASFLKDKTKELPDLIYPLYIDAINQLKAFGLTQGAKWLPVPTNIERQFIFRLLSDELKE